jgi:NADPH-dependent glutamate synthase beta subunit-like oxidoreductase
MNTKVGVDVSMEELEKDYDAVLFAIGAMSGRSLPIPGGEAANCVSGVAFLEAYNQGRLKHITGKVICIGGGDTSIDVVIKLRAFNRCRAILFQANHTQCNSTTIAICHYFHRL